jgi:hypothetical protein
VELEDEEQAGRDHDEGGGLGAAGAGLHERVLF